MAEINKIKVSELDPETDGKGFWIFGYKNEGGRSSSRKFAFEKLKEVVEAAADKVVLERRIAVVLERPLQLVPIGEPMSITKVVARNVEKLEYKLNTTNNNTWIKIEPNTELTGNAIKKLDGKNDIVIRITSTQKEVGYTDFDKFSTITIFAKAELKQ